MSGSCDDTKTYWTYRRYSDFHDVDLRLREALGEDNFPLELPKKTLFRDLKNEFLTERSALLNDYLQHFVQIAHERRMIFHILEDFLSIDMYINRKKTIQKRVDSIVSPFKKATRDAGQDSIENFSPASSVGRALDS